MIIYINWLWKDLDDVAVLQRSLGILEYGWVGALPFGFKARIMKQISEKICYNLRVYQAFLNDLKNINRLDFFSRHAIRCK